MIESGFCFNLIRNFVLVYLERLCCCVKSEILLGVNWFCVVVRINSLVGNVDF